jgi:hypothetical protein
VLEHVDRGTCFVELRQDVHCAFPSVGFWG